MGHVVGKDIYRKLDIKIDNLSIRAPWNRTFHEILRKLYSPEEADVIVKMPYGMTDFDSIVRITKYDSLQLRNILDSLADKGLVIDVRIKEKSLYMPSPMIIGIFEFTMMRTDSAVDSKEMGKLFHEYLQDGSFYKANFGSGQKISPLRTIPHAETIDSSEYVEVLDYEKAETIINRADRFAVGICSCRHEKLHAGEKKCTIPLENCVTLGNAADYMIRHKLAREAAKSEIFDILAESKESGLVLNADNSKNNVSFICHCCGCCCNLLLGISKFGYPNIIVTSRFIADFDEEACASCGLCAESCPINAIEMTDENKPHINKDLCIGCGVCALKCETEAMRLKQREQRVILPETTFERIILQSLERGTVQNLIFDNPQKITHKFMRGFFGAFLKLPAAKKALMSEQLRSRFLNMMKR